MQRGVKHGLVEVVLGLVALIGIVALLVPLAAAESREFPSWDKQINKPSRFKVLNDFGGAAVLDKETGLVWDQSSDTTPARTWLNALTHCYQRTVGGRNGWRLPTIEELASLFDPNNPSGDPDLPPGHPFSNVQAVFYWSATTLASGYQPRVGGDLQHWRCGHQS